MVTSASEKEQLPVMPIGGEAKLMQRIRSP